MSSPSSSSSPLSSSSSLSSLMISPLSNNSISDDENRDDKSNSITLNKKKKSIMALEQSSDGSTVACTVDISSCSCSDTGSSASSLVPDVDDDDDEALFLFSSTSSSQSSRSNISRQFEEVKHVLFRTSNDSNDDDDDGKSTLNEKQHQVQHQSSGISTNATKSSSSRFFPFNSKLLSESKSASDDNHQRATRRQYFKLAFGATGVYVCYLWYGHIQEQLFTQQWNGGRKFKEVWFLQVLECSCNIVVGFLGRSIVNGKNSSRASRSSLDDKSSSSNSNQQQSFFHSISQQLASLWPFFTSGASQVFAKVTTSLALAAGLSYPICILCKSAKLLPVMIGQHLLGTTTIQSKQSKTLSSEFQPREFVYAALIVVGTCLLSYQPKSQSQKTTTPAGLVFIAISLVMDGITGGLQKRLKQHSKQKFVEQQNQQMQLPAKHNSSQPPMSQSQPSTYDFLLFTNLSMFVIALTISLAIGDFHKGHAFIFFNNSSDNNDNSPLLLTMIGTVCLLSALGQSFVFYLVAHFDPTVCAVVTTTRKILSVLWSFLLQQQRQWLATAAVVTAVGSATTTATTASVSAHPPPLSLQASVGLFLAITGVLLGLQEHLNKLKEKSSSSSLSPGKSSKLAFPVVSNEQQEQQQPLYVNRTSRTGTANRQSSFLEVV